MIAACYESTTESQSWDQGSSCSYHSPINTQSTCLKRTSQFFIHHSVHVCLRPAASPNEVQHGVGVLLKGVVDEGDANGDSASTNNE